MRCPGQDWRYWKEDAVFEVPCPECGAAVEFFKDETSGRCCQCGHRFRNPGIDFGCAKWCALAEECLGFVPERELPTDSGEGALAGRLIQEVKQAFEADLARLTHSLKVFHYAKELVSKQGGDPRVVLAAALLLDVAVSDATTEGETRAPSRAKQILDEIGADADTIERVCHIVGSHQAGTELDTIEFMIVRDADTLARLAKEGPGDDLNRLAKYIEKQLKTDAAKQKARALLQAEGSQEPD